MFELPTLAVNVLDTLVDKWLANATQLKSTDSLIKTQDPGQLVRTHSHYLEDLSA